MKKVLVTGGNKGIGFGICQVLLQETTDVAVILGARDAARGQAAVEKLKAITPGAVDRIELVLLDTTSPASVQQAASQIQGPLYGIINNAAIGDGKSQFETLATNYWGAKWVTEAMLPKLQADGRVVMISSAAGPYFLSNLKKKNDPMCSKLAEPWTIRDFEELDEISRTYKVEDQGPKSWDSYGFSKALLSAYTYLLSRAHPGLVINSLTPGFVKTDLTVGRNATKTPEEGAVPAIYCLLNEEVATKPQGRFYGSDCKRSPLDEYREPGSPEYEGPDGP